MCLNLGLKDTMDGNLPTIYTSRTTICLNGLTFNTTLTTRRKCSAMHFATR